MNLWQALGRKAVTKITLGGTGGTFDEGPFWSRPPATSDVWSRPITDWIDSDDYTSYARNVYKANGPVFAVSTIRQLIFSEATFGWRPVINGKPGDIDRLDGLESLDAALPSLSGFLNRWECDTTNAGNGYATHVDDSGNYGKRATGPGRRVTRLNPHWCQLILGSASDDPRAIDAKPVGLRYKPDGTTEDKAIILLEGEFAHYAPHPDPDALYRGMSWVTPILGEVAADSNATELKKAFFENGAAINQVMVFDRETKQEEFEYFIDKFEEEHVGVKNGFKTFFLGGGADPRPMGFSMQQLDMRALQAFSELRVSANGGVPPDIAGFAGGQSTTIGTGTYLPQRKRLADGTMRPLWRTAATALEKIFTPPTKKHRLWYNDEEIPFLRDDLDAISTIMSRNAQTMKTWIDAGFEAESVKDAMKSEDISLLKHSGLFSVQLQEPGSGKAPGEAPQAEPPVGDEQQPPTPSDQGGQS